MKKLSTTEKMLVASLSFTVFLVAVRIAISHQNFISFLYLELVPSCNTGNGEPQAKFGGKYRP